MMPECTSQSAVYPRDDLRRSDWFFGTKILCGEVVEEPVASQLLNWPCLQRHAITCFGTERSFLVTSG